MNVFKAKVTADANTVTYAIDGGLSLAYPGASLSPAPRDLLRRQASLSLGTRPHALHIGKGGIRGKVISCQWLGDQTHVAIDAGGRTVVAVSHERVRAQPGSDLELSAAASDLHLFDAESGAAIAHGDALA